MGPFQDDRALLRTPSWYRKSGTQKSRRGGRVKELIATIEDYIEKHNDKPKSFTWTAKAEDILEKARRARAVLDQMQTA